MEGEAYLDIVWKNFKRNRYSVYALYVILFLFAVAIFAPLIASNQPLIFWDKDEVIYPWFHALFNPETIDIAFDFFGKRYKFSIDYIFNVALVMFIPWVITSAILLIIWKKYQVKTRKIILRVVLIYLVFTAVGSVLVIFGEVKPKNLYFGRDFKEEIFKDPSKKGIFTLIPLSATEQDLVILYKEPFFRKDKELQKKYETFPRILGTDGIGRDVLVRLIYGARISLTVGFIAVSIYIAVGTIIGSIAGYFGGLVDIVISRVIEIIMLFPSFFLIITLVAMIGPSVYIIMLVIGFTGWPGIARLIRGEFLKQRTIDYVTAARALGVSHLRIIFRHILPNGITPVFVSAPFGVAGAIITEAALSLLGFGVRPPTPSWGGILNEAFQHYSFWWLSIFPGIAIFLAVTSFNLIGAGLRDAIDPRLKV